MKQTVEAYSIAEGVVEPKHEVEVVCSSCADPVSKEEETSGVCTACGAPWNPKQNVTIFVTSVPMNAVVTSFI